MEITKYSCDCVYCCFGMYLFFYEYEELDVFFNFKKEIYTK